MYFHLFKRFLSFNEIVWPRIFRALGPTIVTQVLRLLFVRVTLVVKDQVHRLAPLVHRQVLLPFQAAITLGRLFFHFEPPKGLSTLLQFLHCPSFEYCDSGSS